MQINPLPITLVPREREMMSSVLSRLAGRNGVDVRQFCRDFRLPLTDLARCDPRAIATLSQLVSIPTEELLRWTVNPSLPWFAGHRLTLTSLKKGGLWGCPACLREEIDANEGPFAQRMAIRGHWQLNALTVCPIHNSPLVALWQDARGKRRPDIDIRLHEIYPEILSGDLDETDRQPNAFEHWFERQLQGERDLGWLGSFGLFEAADLCLWLGELATRPNAGGSRTMPNHMARDCGFAIASQGKAAVTEKLAELQLANTKPTSKKEVLGKLFTSFKGNAGLYKRQT